MTAVEPAATPGHPRRLLAPGALAQAVYRRSSGLTGFLYPLEFALVLIVAFALQLSVSPWAVFRTVIITFGIVVALMCVLRLVLRNVHRAGIAMMLIFLLVASGTRPVAAALFVLAAIIVVVFDRLPARRFSWAQVSGGLSTFMSIMLVIVLVQAGLDGRLGKTLGELPQGGGLSSDGSAALVDPSKPDIYLLILDGYPRPDTLKSSFGVDDGPFVDQLESRGFDVATNSHSNYPATPYTLASMLNMAYLDDIPQIAGIHVADPGSSGAYLDAINRNRVFELLRGEGYQIVATGSGWEQLAIRQSDVYMDGGQLNTYEAVMLYVSGLSGAVQFVAPNWAGDQARSRIDGDFAEIRQVAATPSTPPRLVISHVLAPHPPLVYGPNGEALPLDLSTEFGFDYAGGGSDQQTRAAYAGQTLYVNRQVVPTVDAILSSARRPTVVVLMSDHGSRLDAATEQAPEADRNFFATLTPGHAGLYGATPTPINLFPHLLDTYLGLEIPILPDRSYLMSQTGTAPFTPMPAGTP
jgi:hypothetical protein